MYTSIKYFYYVAQSCSTMKHAHVSRMDQYNRFLAENLVAKRYKMMNAFDLTAGESMVIVGIHQWTAAISAPTCPLDA
jgi:hypothetical protein